MCPLNNPGLNGSFDFDFSHSIIVEDKLLKIFKNNTIFDRYKNELDKNEEKYYYILFSGVTAVVMVTLIVKN